MSEPTIVLSERDIARIVNGEEVTTKINGEKIIIRQSFLKDATRDMLVRDFRVMNTATNSFEY